jgi:hypothetical protein
MISASEDHSSVRKEFSEAPLLNIPLKYPWGVWQSAQPEISLLLLKCQQPTAGLLTVHFTSCCQIFLSAAKPIPKEVNRAR